ncbi:hypothetical protein [Streptomyces sp. NBC_00648]|uniref:hypothetical protein n=1 Tax=Streptomyces sp. NBC_00648 TaxID=2975797 RepID=UPI00324C2062
MEPAATRVRARKRRLAGPRANLAVGALFDTGVRWLPWACMAATGLLCAGAWLHRSRQLTPRPALVAVAG